tara:strand:- start:42 stop:545 length:504 start_codon:yes stop_codon:yes gene_type:complete
MENIKETEKFVMNQTMLRIKDPKASLQFYQNVLGMTLFDTFHFEKMNFSLYFLGYSAKGAQIPEDKKEKRRWMFSQPALIELTHNHGTEVDKSFKGYHDGNEEPQGFGHIGISVPDVYTACERFEKLGVDFIKKPDDGKMKGLAFIRDPDGYWIEILSPSGLTSLSP